MVDRGHLEDLLEQLERDVLEMDRTGDSSIVHLLFRTAHNLKSSTAQAELASLSPVIHELEDMLDRIRRGKILWNAACFDRVTRVIDLVRLAVQSEPSSAEAAPKRETSKSTLPRPGLKRWGIELSEGELAACARAEADGLGLYRIEKLFKKGLSAETFHSLPVMEDIRELGTLIAMQPSWETYSEGPEDQVVKLLFASSKSAEQLAEILFDPLIPVHVPAVPLPKPRTEALRFLIIEDDPTAGGLLRYILRQQGDCDLYETGTEGLAAFRGHLDRGTPFDLVVLDLFLPDLHGHEILNEIRAYESQHGIRDPLTRCLVLINTASKDLGQMLEALKGEPDGYLIKPINVDFLMEKVTVLKSQRMGQT